MVTSKKRQETARKLGVKMKDSRKFKDQTKFHLNRLQNIFDNLHWIYIYYWNLYIIGSPYIILVIQMEDLIFDFNWDILKQDW